MPRALTIEIVTDKPVTQTISVRRAETLRITLSQEVASVALTISPTAGGEPIVEIPGTAGLIIISPSLVSSLTEGQSYQMNIWNTTNLADPLQLVNGTFKTENTIQPGFVEYASQYLSSGVTIVHLTQAEYDEIVEFPADTIYIITEAAA